LGFVRNHFINRIFGDASPADVVNGVFYYPNLLRKLFAEGALSSAFIPTLSQALIEDPSGKRPKRIARNLISFQLLVLIPLVLLGAIFADPLVRILLHFKEVWKIELAINLFRWAFSYILFISISAAIMGALNSRGVFIIPAITPILFSACVISSIIFLKTPFAVAIGIVAGGIAQILFQVPSYLKKGYDFKPDFKLNNADFKRILKQWLPVLISASIFAINQAIAMTLASGLEDGSATAIHNAIIFFQLPLGIFANSIIIVLLPKMSRQAVRGDIDGLRESLSYGLRFMFLFLIPSSIALILLGEDFIAILFQYDKFTELGTQRAASVLTGLAIGLFCTGALNFFHRFYYARKDYKTPIIIAAIILIVDVALSLWLKETILRVAGLAVANSIGFTVGLLCIVIITKRQLGSIHGKKLFICFLKVILIMIPFSGLLLLYKFIIKPYFGIQDFWIRIFLLGSVCIGCILIVMGLYLLLRIDIIEDIVKRRLTKKE